MYSAIGYGGVTVNQVIFRLLDYFRKEAPAPIVTKPFRSKDAHGTVRINGETGLLVSFAGCCSPVPGDDIVGFVTHGRGVVVHRRDCPNMRNADPARLQPAEWVEQAAGVNYKVAIVVTAQEQGAAIAAISSVVSDMKLSIAAINGRDKNNYAIVDVTVGLPSLRDAEELINRLSSRPKIMNVHRLTN